MTSASGSTAPTASTAASSPPDGQLSRATAMPAVTATTTPADLPADVMAQPDLFARAFVTRLLTQDYRQPRTELLGWVQAHAAQSTDPLVMGLIPSDLRDKWAVFSVTDTGSGPAPVPTPTEWEGLAGRSARTTVQIQHVNQPYSWTSAVATGRITDAGVTGREVTALVTLHTVDDGSPHTATTSVALSFNLEGPPTRDHWGFVTLAAYTVVPLAGS
ncbi:hypothetical protein [Lapillicoccus sp.]|uniref:hypothetical protein n=1 Tax=Lapillicoccus sp. TaxID=1909287 RepID=UPI0039837736